MNTPPEGSTTSIFGLFESRDWSSFKTFPRPVQHDIGSLLLLDSLTKSSIAKEVEQLSRAGPTSALATRMRGDASLAGELQICLLSTAVGKALNQVPWSVLASERTIDCLGALALCEFRNRDTLEGDLDLSLSGYSADPDEARTQFLR